MTQWVKGAVWLFFILGLLATGGLGTETRLFFFWPGCALLGLGALATGLRWHWQMRTTPCDVCLATALLFAVYFLVRQISSPVVIWWREDFFLLLACGVAYLLSATVLSHARWRGGLVWALYIVLLGNLAVGYVHFSGHWSFHIVPGYLRSFGGGEGGRIGGFFNNPNHLGAFLVMMTMLSLGLACFGRGQNLLSRLLFLLAAAASAVGMTKTGSRGAIVGLAAGVVALSVITVMLMRWTRPHLLGKTLLAIVAGGGIVVVVLGAVMSEQMQQRFSGGVPQDDPRRLIWKSALAQHGEHPWLGAGARMFYEGCIRLRPADAPMWLKDAQFAHNDWLQALCDYGWTGLALVGLMFAVHLRNGWRFLRWFASEQFPRTATLGGVRLGLLAGALASVIALMVHAFFEFHFHIPAVAVMAAALLGVLANPGVESSFWQPRQWPGVRLLGKVALPVSGAVLLWGTWVIGHADCLVERARLAGKLAGNSAPDVELLSRALRIDPTNAETWHERGLALIEAAEGKPFKMAQPALARAATDLERSLALNPWNPYPSLALADVCDVLGNYDEAERHIMDAVQAAPLFHEPRLALAIHRFRLQQWDLADEAFLLAGETQAGRTSDEWFDLYREMLQEAMSP